MLHIFSQLHQNTEEVETVDSFTRYDEIFVDNSTNVEKIINNCVFTLISLSMGGRGLGAAFIALHTTIYSDFITCNDLG